MIVIKLIYDIIFNKNVNLIKKKQAGGKPLNNKKYIVNGLLFVYFLWNFIIKFKL